MQMWIYCANYLQTVLPNESLEYECKTKRPNAGYSTFLASFLMQQVSMCLLFIISCFSAGEALKTIYYF